MLSLSKVYLFLFFILIIGIFFNIYFNIGIFDDMTYFLTVLLILFIIFNTKKIVYRMKDFNLLILLLIYFFLNLIVSCVFFYKFFYIPSILYEIFKLIIPFILIPIFLFINGIKLRNLLKILNYFLFYLLIINLLIEILQIVFGPSIIQSFGVSNKIADQFTKGRPTGFFFGPNTLADFSLMIFIYTKILENYYFDIVRGFIKFIKKLQILSIIVIFLSLSKHAILILLLYPLFLYKGILKKILFLNIFIPFIVYFAYIYDVAHLKTKVDTYLYLFENFSHINTSLIEARAKYYLEAFNILKENFPFGIGFGTWGDASSRINPYVNNLSWFHDMSDSYLSHLLVEQGIFVILYIYILYKILKFTKIGRYMFFSFLLLSIVTMSLSSSSWPYLLSTNIALLYKLNYKGINENINNN